MVKSLFGIVKKLIFTKTGQGSLIMIVGSILVGTINFFFHLIFNNILGPTKYGEVATLISIFTISSVSVIALSTVVVKYTSTYKGKGDYSSIKTLLTELTKKLSFIGILIFSLFFIFSSFIKDFLNLDSSYPVVMLGLSILFAFLFYINMGVLQGLLDFTFYTISNLIMASFRIIFPLIAVIILKFSVTGVMFAVALSILVAYLFSFYPLKFLAGEKGKGELEWKGLLKFTAATLVTVLGLGVLSSVDLILVKHFFDPKEAGIYASASIIGKIILFSTAPIVQIMFPLVSERHAASRGYLHLLFYSLALVSLAGGVITLAYFLFPTLIVTVMLPKSAGIIPYLGLFGILISIYSLVNVFVNFFLSVNKTAVAYSTIGAGFLLTVLLWFYHSSLTQVIMVGILVNLLLLSYLVLYFLLNYAKKSS